MRRAFVVQLGPETQHLKRHFAGVIEEVDSGREAKFHSTEELLDFLSNCCELALRRDDERQENDSDPP
jgi:hypothetical protein